MVLPSTPLARWTLYCAIVKTSFHIDSIETVVTLREDKIALPIHYHAQFSTHFFEMQGEVGYLVARQS